MNTAARLGILMLDSRFPRIEGDVGNPATWDFPVRYSVVPGATPSAIVEEDASAFMGAFFAAGKDLVAAGCTGIATTCGFLAPMRAELAAQLGVPVAASALEQSAQIKACLPRGQKVGILTISKASLSRAHLVSAAVPPDSAIVGVEDSLFAQTILRDLPDLNVPRARDELVIAAKALVSQTPETGAILLECTNMVPYAPDIARVTGRPVYSIFTYLNWFHQSLAPQVFASSMT